MKVYVVKERMSDDLTDLRVSAIFSTLELAQAYVDAHQEYDFVWYDEDEGEDLPLLSISEYEVDAE